MKIGELIRNYRIDNDLSQRQFAIRCGLSNGYISILEKGINPNTGKPVIPTIPQLQKLADGMRMTLMELMDTVDDMPVDLSIAAPLPDIAAPLPAVNQAPADGDRNVLRLAGRDGSHLERVLSDQQLDLIKQMLAQLPDASDDL